MKQTIYRKVSVEDELPTKAGFYIAESEWIEDNTTLPFDTSDTYFDGEKWAMGEKWRVNYWLKEMELPTDEEINEKWEERNSSGTYLEGNMCRREGAKYIINKILGK